MTSRPGISVLVPVYNEAATVGQVLHQITATMGQIDVPYEILVIDDGSTDTSLGIVQTLADPTIRIVGHPANRGYGAALTTGVLQARAATIVIIDADGTYPPASIPALVASLDTHVMAVGVRGHAAFQVAPLRYLAKQPLRWLAEILTGQPIPDLNTGLRAIRREAILPWLPLLPARFSWTSTITVALLGSGQPVAFLPIAYGRRQGASKFHPLIDTLRAVHCIIKAARVVQPRRTRLAIGGGTLMMLLVVVWLYSMRASYRR